MAMKLLCTVAAKLYAWQQNPFLWKHYLFVTDAMATAPREVMTMTVARLRAE